MNTTYKQFIVALITLCTTAMIKTSVSLPADIPAPTAKVTVTKKVPPVIKGNTWVFMQAISRVESNHRIDIVNQNGCMGKYQFCQGTFQFLKNRNYIDSTITREQFLADDSIQNVAMLALMRYNYKQLAPIIRTYRGTWYNGIYISTSGLLAAAHLVGVGGVNHYFHPDNAQYANFVIQDANGTTIEHYLHKFSNYSINL